MIALVVLQGDKAANPNMAPTTSPTSKTAAAVPSRPVTQPASAK